MARPRPSKNPAPPPASAGRPTLVWWILCALAAVTFFSYYQVRTHAFVEYDDQLYVTKNPIVQKGLTWEGLHWATANLTGEKTYWHPVTWLSHMLDCQLFGLDPAGPHLLNVFFHILNVLLVFLLFRQMTGAVWRSAILAALFAWHPIQVDTVAWVAERKNLLSTLFWLLTLMAYTRHVRSPAAAAFWRSPFYWGALGLYALGLMCKPMLTTVPCVMLLLDAWPLNRISRGLQPAASGAVAGAGMVRMWARLFIEKLPFFALAAASSVVTLLGHKRLNLLMSMETVSFPLRINNTVKNYLEYLRKTLWPDDLAVFYQPMAPWPGWKLALAVLLLLAVTGLVLAWMRRRPYLLVGWFWFLGTLVPVIGIIQAGIQAMADRFAYVPLLGLFLAMVWGVADLLERRPFKALAGAVLAAGALLACLVVTQTQIRSWRNTLTLFEHATRVTQGNLIAHLNYGNALTDAGRFDEAVAQYRIALTLSPEAASGHFYLASALEKQGNIPEAVEHYEETLRLNPEYYLAQNNYASVLVNLGRIPEAIDRYQTAVRISPEYAEGHYNLAIVLAQVRRYDEAVAHYECALRLKPDFADAHNNLGVVLVQLKNYAQAAQHLEAAARLMPGDGETLFNYGNVLQELGRTNEARAVFTEALRLQPGLIEAYKKVQKP